jgi:hypothetical protein
MPGDHNKIESVRAGRLLRVGRDLFSITLDDRLLWRILLPVAGNDGLLFLSRHHKRFYDLVLELSGGSTENSWSNGNWIDEGVLYQDRVVPLEFLATTEEAEKILAFACKHYDQSEILCYPISDRVLHCRRAEKEVTSSAESRTLRPTTANDEKMTLINGLLEESKQ